jgi:hypothetical protein
MERLGANSQKEPMIGQGDMAPRPGQEGSVAPSDQVPIQRADAVPPGGNPLGHDERRFNPDTKRMTVVPEAGGPSQEYRTTRQWPRFNKNLRQYTDESGEKHKFNASQIIGPPHSTVTPPDPNVPAQGTHAPPPAQSPPAGSSNTTRGGSHAGRGRR